MMNSISRTTSVPICFSLGTMLIDYFEHTDDARDYLRLERSLPYAAASFSVIEAVLSFFFSMRLSIFSIMF